jgi:predicted Zn-dependent peptidase
MTVVVSEERGSGRLAAVLMVHAGDADDPEAAVGANRLLARLLVDESAHRGPARFASAGIDGNMWSEAEADVTSFSVVTTPDQAPAALRLLNLVLEPPAWDTASVQRAVKQEDDRGRKRAPSDWERSLAAWQAGAGVVAVVPHLQSPQISAGKLRTLHTRLYVPNRMVLAVAGDTSAHTIFGEATRVFKKLSPRMTAPAAQLRRSAPRVGAGPFVFVGYRAPAATDPDAAAMEVVAAAIGTGKTSAIFRQLREAEGTGYESGVVYQRRLTTSAIGLFTRAAGSTASASDTLSEIWKRVGSQDWSASRSRARHSYRMQRQTARDRAYGFAFWETSGKGAAYDSVFGDALSSVTAQEVEAALKRWIVGTPVTVP